MDFRIPQAVPDAVIVPAESAVVFTENEVAVAEQPPYRLQPQCRSVKLLRRWLQGSHISSR